MREVFLKNTNLPKFPNVTNPKPVAEKLNEILNPLYNANGIKISMELCSNRYLDVNTLFSINPLFYSITWHTQPSINYNNNLVDVPAVELASALLDRSKHVLLHLPCRYLSKENICNILTTAKQKGIKNVLALWGERIRSANCPDESNDFSYAVDLVSFIKQHFENTFCVGVTGYPECHPKSGSASTDLTHLKQKVDAGADFILTQMFFESDTFHNFYKNCREIGIEVPIIPGINIIDSYDSLLLMAHICNVNIPENILSAIESIKGNNTDVRNYGIQHASKLIINLLSNKVYPIPCVHLFCLNDIENVQMIYENVGKTLSS